MPVPTEIKIKALQKDFRSARRLAELLDVEPSQILGWKKGEDPGWREAEKIALLELVMSALLRFCPGEVAELWLFGMNPGLGGSRPVDLLRQGRAAELLDALAEFRAGAFA